ncbi:MAG TPA: hypothetical protein VEU11_05880 [Terriglobales bacterium]|nr:hypothetical protein [Terriglobales bacterium]
MKTGSFGRADKLMAAGVSALTCAFLVLLVPSVGILFLEILVGLSFVAWALVVRRRLRKMVTLGLNVLERGAVQTADNTESRVRVLDRYGLTLIASVIVIYGGISGFLRSRGFSEGVVRIVPLVFFALGLLAKPLVMRWLETRRGRSRPALSGGDS